MYWKAILGALGFLICVGTSHAQVDDFCTEFGSTPSLNSPWAQVPYVYGRISLKGYGAGSKQPKVTIVLVDPQQTQKRLTLERSGNYCFRRSAGSSGTLIVDVNGVEVSRRSISSFGAAQQREDFEIHATDVDRPAPPGSISAKFTHPPNERTADLYRQAVEAEKTKDEKQVVEMLKKIVAVDPQDFIAWAKLGTRYLERNSLAEAEAALRKSIELRIDYVPAWIVVGQLRIAQKQFEAAAEVLKHAVSLDPASARAYQLLGEAYLQSRQGTLGVEALNQAIKLEPIAMAECHLQLAHLYQLAGAKPLASREYRLFLEKVADHVNKEKFEKFIKENPETNSKN